MQILILAESGFGKTTAIGANSKLKIKGLDPKKTLIIQPIAKDLPFPGGNSDYKIVMNGKDANGKSTILGNRVINSSIEKTIEIITKIASINPGIDNFVFDDFNIYMQKYYMANAKSKNYGVFTDIGCQMDAVYRLIDNLAAIGKNIFILAHPEIYEDVEGNRKFKMKTVGKMVDNYLSPTALTSITLMGREIVDKTSGEVKRVFVTNSDGLYNAKSPFGMFDDLYIPNDLGLIKKQAELYYNNNN